MLSPEPPHKKAGHSISVKHVIDNIKVGDSLDFSIRINPVISKKTDANAKRGVRKAVPTHDLKRWLDNKFIKYGFWADYYFDQKNFRESVKNGSLISIASFLVSGSLEVLHPDSVRCALTEGIGRGKGLGFGMLHVYDSLTVGSNT